jgi:hypothetical protein
MATSSLCITAGQYNCQIGGLTAYPKTALEKGQSHLLRASFCLTAFGANWDSPRRFSDGSRSNGSASPVYPVPERSIDPRPERSPFAGPSVPMPFWLQRLDRTGDYRQVRELLAEIVADLRAGDDPGELSRSIDKAIRRAASIG